MNSRLRLQTGGILRYIRGGVKTFLGLKLAVWDFFGGEKFSGGPILGKRFLQDIKSERTSGFSIPCSTIA